MKILCAGMLVADVIARPVDFERLGEDTVPVEKISVQNGGDAMNVAIGLAKLGRKTGFCGKVGDDMFGAFLRGVFEKHGVDTRGLKVSRETATSSCIALVRENGQRMFLYSAGANNFFGADDVDDALIGECSHLHISGVNGMARLDAGDAARILRRAREMGKTTSMDVTWDNQNRWLSVVESALPWLDFFMPSEAEAALITGESDPVKMAEFLRGKGVKTAIVKLGEKGVYADGGGTERFHLPAFNVPVVDTTGAGDSFTAGFLAKHTQGASLRECARYASAVAAHCVGAVGATAGIPDAETVEEFLIDNF